MPRTHTHSHALTEWKKWLHTWASRWGNSTECLFNQTCFSLSLSIFYYLLSLTHIHTPTHPHTHTHTQIRTSSRSPLSLSISFSWICMCCCYLNRASILLTEQGCLFQLSFLSLAFAVFVSRTLDLLSLILSLTHTHKQTLPLLLRITATTHV